MVLELGPYPAEDVQRWSRVVRRILVELRSTPDGEDLVSPDVIELWSRTLDDWSRIADRLTEGGGDDPAPFRWTGELEPEVVEFLLDGLERCLHSPTVMSWITPEEAEQQRTFTMQVVQAFVDGLTAEGHGCQHYADQILVSLGGLLED